MMKGRHTHIIILIICLFPVLAGCPGCKPDSPPDDPKPFVRLLTDQSIQSRKLNRPVKYAVLLPKEYEKGNASFPVVYLLHGFGDDETGWYKWGLINYYVDLYEAETVPMIYVMPQGFNTYWVNKFSGTFPYMDMLVGELVPVIDSIFRTIRDPQHRATMGYSMGGYGAMILPAKNPGVFMTGVGLSMSFRTDQQYIDEPQSVFDYQWGSVFGGTGLTGTARLTDYYKEFCPFYFFKNSGDLSVKGQHYFFDCGDDEESLTIPNNELHSLLRELNIKHEFRVKNGAHTWDYWRKALPEALRFIGKSVSGTPFPDDPAPFDPGPLVSAERIKTRQTDGLALGYNVVQPATYQADNKSYPVVIVLHDRNSAEDGLESQQLYSTFNSLFTEGKIPASIIVEIPLPDDGLNVEMLKQVISQVRTEYRTKAEPGFTILLGNDQAGRIAYDLLNELNSEINSCLLFDASLPENASVSSPGITYYLDICDEGVNFKGYRSLFMDIRQKETAHEYRVRQGTPSHHSFLAGLCEAAAFMNTHLQ